MTNKLKIKLTREQIRLVYHAVCNQISFNWLDISVPEIEIDESQIIKNDSVNKNEKTRVVIPRYKIQEAIAELERANCSYYIFSVEEDKIFKEKSNVEKWEEVMRHSVHNLRAKTIRDIPMVLDKLGYNADAAYKEVCGE